MYGKSRMIELQSFHWVRSCYPATRPLAHLVAHGGR